MAPRDALSLYGDRQILDLNWTVLAFYLWVIINALLLYNFNMLEMNYLVFLPCSTLLVNADVYNRYCKMRSQTYVKNMCSDAESYGPGLQVAT